MQITQVEEANGQITIYSGTGKLMKFFGLPFLFVAIYFIYVFIYGFILFVQAGKPLDYFSLSNLPGFLTDFFMILLFGVPGFILVFFKHLLLLDRYAGQVSIIRNYIFFKSRENHLISNFSEVVVYYKRSYARKSRRWHTFLVLSLLYQDKNRKGLLLGFPNSPVQAKDIGEKIARQHGLPFRSLSENEKL